MDELARHEQFEIETLDVLNSEKLLEPLLFGGGTMLRLCHGMNRYSVDLDFYFIKPAGHKIFNKKITECLLRHYQLTDAADKHFALLYEFKTKNYPRRLKIEIRKQPKPFKYEETIAFSPHSDKQILLKTITLEQMMQNKIEALLSRDQLRDCFDIEFLLKKGIKIDANPETIEKLKEKALSFNKTGLKTSLGPLLNQQDRDYYIKNGFKMLLSHL